MDAASTEPADYNRNARSESPPIAASDEFERLTLPFLGDVSRFARSLTRDAMTADDLVEETYLQALHGWITVPSSSEPRRWLFALCHRLFLRATRHETLYADVPCDDAELESFATALSHYEASRSGALAALEHVELRSAIHAAFDNVPPDVRGCVVLVDIEGQSYEEAAAVLGIPVGSVRSRLFGGRRLLQDLLFEHACDSGRRGASAEGPSDAHGSAT
jgi:RNA polymerase sigma-70 factor (ECF subfamily)